MTGLARAAALWLLIGGACKDRPAAGPPPGESGLASTQTFEEAMRLTCDAPEKADLPPEEPGDLNRFLLVASWIDQRVTNKEVRQLMGAAAAAETPAGKLAALREGARKAGIERCALAEMWERMASGAPVAPDPAPSSAAKTSTEAPLPTEPQTYDEAMVILCAAPADQTERARLVRERITNADVAQLAGALDADAPAEGRARLHTAARATGINDCPLADGLAAAAAKKAP